jgi:hypothetical protein
MRPDRYEVHARSSDARTRDWAACDRRCLARCWFGPRTVFVLRSGRERGQWELHRACRARGSRSHAQIRRRRGDDQTATKRVRPYGLRKDRRADRDRVNGGRDVPGARPVRPGTTPHRIRLPLPMGEGRPLLLRRPDPRPRLPLKRRPRTHVAHHQASNVEQMAICPAGATSRSYPCLRKTPHRHRVPPGIGAPRLAGRRVRAARISSS